MLHSVKLKPFLRAVRQKPVEEFVMVTKIKVTLPSTRLLNPPANQQAVMCHYCGYEPPMATTPSDGHCPKCRGCSWERFIVPRRVFPLNG
jgi:predicted Zn-ribbon and HTH transcriptional regulator